MRRIVVKNVSLQSTEVGNAPSQALGLKNSYEIPRGASRWADIYDKPFERIGDTLAVVGGTLNVNIHEVHNDAGGLTTIIG